MTVGDSLNTGTIPMRFSNTPSTSDAMRASEITVRGYPWQWSGAEDFTDKSYFETQIFGGISLKDVEKIYVPYGNMDFDADAFAKVFPDIEFVGYDS